MFDLVLLFVSCVNWDKKFFVAVLVSVSKFCTWSWIFDLWYRSWFLISQFWSCHKPVAMAVTCKLFAKLGGRISVAYNCQLTYSRSLQLNLIFCYCVLSLSVSFGDVFIS